MIYRIPLTDIGGDLTGKIFVVNGKLTASNPTKEVIEPKRWHFDLTGSPTGFIREEGENV